MSTTRDLPIQIDLDAIATFCRARGIVRLSLFGSVLRDDFDPARSDIDVFAEFKEGAFKNVGWEFVGYGETLSRIMGYKVDLVTNPRAWLRETLLQDAVPIYVEA